MANFVYTRAATNLLKGDLDFDAPDDIRVMIVMTDTTADTERDAATLDAFTTLDEMDGANYSAYGAALAGEGVSEDTGNDRGEFDATDLTFTTIGVGTRQVAGFIVYLFVTDQTDSVPICWVDDDCPFTANGSDIKITWNAEGILQATTT